METQKFIPDGAQDFAADLGKVDEPTAPDVQEPTVAEATERDLEMPESKGLEILKEKMIHWLKAVNKSMPSPRVIRMIMMLEMAAFGITRDSNNPNEDPRIDQELFHIDTIEYVQEDYLRKVYGNYFRLPSDEEDSHAVEARLQDPSAPTIEMRGFREVQFDSLEARKIFFDTYPKHWVDDEIRSVSFEPTVVESLPPQYGISGTKAGEVQHDPRGAAVRLFQKYHGQIMETYSHEVGHAVDWNSRHLPLVDRQYLLMSVTKRFLSGDSLFRSEYVEDINNANPQEELLLKVQEYWAEICAGYFELPGFKNTNPKDFELVDSWVKRTDPDYDLHASDKQRQSILHEAHLRSTLDGVPEALVPELQQIRQMAADDFVRINQINKKEGRPPAVYAFIQGQTMISLEKFCQVNNLDTKKVFDQTFYWLTLMIEDLEKKY